MHEHRWCLGAHTLSISAAVSMFQTCEETDFVPENKGLKSVCHYDWGSIDDSDFFLSMVSDVGVRMVFFAASHVCSSWFH